MNVEIGAEAALFPEKEDINGIAVAVRLSRLTNWKRNEFQLRKMEKLKFVFFPSSEANHGNYKNENNVLRSD
jgi:hypothetical protein